jgi:hypothetical protein
MTALIESYPYFVASLVFLGLLGVGLGLCPRPYRRTAVLSGLLAAPFALTSFTVVPYYWTPVRVVEFVAGPEDVILGLACGGLVWLLAAWPLRHRINLAPALRPSFRRYMQCSVVGLGVGVVLLQCPVRPMTYTIVPILAVGLMVLYLRRDFWPLALTGAAGFTLFYVVLLRASFTVLPGFYSQWNTANLWGPHVGGLPLDEIAWAAACGAVWPLMMAYVLGVRLRPADAVLQYD